MSKVGWIAGFTAALFWLGSPLAQETPSAEAYVDHVGGQARIVSDGNVKLAGRTQTCGPQPIVLDPGLDDYSAAYPGFMILNPKLLERVPPTVQLWVFAVGCSMARSAGNSPDCDAVQDGRRRGWLTSEGVEEICTFVGPSKGDAIHPPGPVRCDRMRKCFSEP